MQTVCIIVIAILMLFVPIYIKLNCAFDVEVKKLYFCVDIFGLSVLCGYCTIDGLKLYFHINNKRALCFDVKEYIEKKRWGVSLKGVQLYSLQVQTRCSFTNVNLLNTLTISQLVSEELLPIVCNRFNYLKLSNDIVICSSDGFYILSKIGLFLNLFAIICIYFKRMVKNVKSKK